MRAEGRLTVAMTQAGLSASTGSSSTASPSATVTIQPPMRQRAWLRSVPASSVQTLPIWLTGMSSSSRSRCSASASSALYSRPPTRP